MSAGVLITLRFSPESVRNMATFSNEKSKSHKIGTYTPLFTLSLCHTFYDLWAKVNLSIIAIWEMATSHHLFHVHGVTTIQAVHW